VFNFNKSTNVLSIRELPIKRWTKDYKDMLEKLIQETDSIATDYREYHTKHTIHFDIQLTGECNFEKVFKLSSNLAISNMVLFNMEGRLVKYTDIALIIEEHYQIRLEFYEKRK
jgi:DNA topoisomerase-2